MSYHVGSGAQVLCWKLQGSSAYGFLNKSLNADGAFFVQREGRFEAHIVECKRTVTQESWDKAKRQMFWTLLRLRSLAGVLGVELTKVVCHTAYVDDELRSDRSPEPAENKIPIGDDEAMTEEDAEDVECRRRQFDWEGDVVHLRGVDGALHHLKVPLRVDNGVAVGECELR